MAHDRAQDTDGDQSDEEPDVADWSNPSPDERDELLALPLPELARLVGLHPELAAFLRAGIEAVRSAEAGEHEALSDALRSANARSRQFVEALMRRLSEDGVSDRELDRIYDLLDKLQAGDQTVTSEVIHAHGGSSTKVLLTLGGLAVVGLLVFAVRANGTPPVR